MEGCRSGGRYSTLSVVVWEKGLKPAGKWAIRKMAKMRVKAAPKEAKKETEKPVDMETIDKDTEIEDKKD